MNIIVIAIIVVTVIGIACAAVLSVASKVMAVEVDERIPKVNACLPGANCGGCGFPGCEGYAAALVNDPDLELTLCAPGGETAMKAISEILGRSGGEMVKKTAFIGCAGDCNSTENKMEYKGIESCAAARLMFGGAGKCVFGCLGFGDCANVCKENAICIENGIAHVNPRLCTGCGSCLKVCPNNIISLAAEGENVRIACSNKEKGAAVRKICKSGCIGCGLCKKNCPEEAITIKDNLAVIDYSRCTSCGACESVCPTKCIVKG